MSNAIEVLVFDRPEEMVVSAYLKMQSEMLMILHDHGIQWDGIICTMKMETWYHLCALPEQTSASLQKVTRVIIEFDIADFHLSLEEDLSDLISRYIESL